MVNCVISHYNERGSLYTKESLNVGVWVNKYVCLYCYWFKSSQLTGLNIYSFRWEVGWLNKKLDCVRMAMGLWVPMYRLENVSISVFVCRHVMMLSVAGRDLDGLLSPPAPWVGWPSALLDVLVLSGLHEGSYCYPRQCPLEEQAPGRWRFSHPALFCLWDSLCCFSASPTLKSISLQLLFYWRLGTKYCCQCDLWPLASSLVSPILVESRPNTHAGVWGPACPGLTLFYFYFLLEYNWFIILC